MILPPPTIHRPTQSFEEAQMAVLEVSDASNPAAKAPSYTNFKVPLDPSLSSEKYGVWRRESIFWRELYFYVPDMHLLSIIGLHAGSTLKKLLIKFHHQTRDAISQRSLSNLLEMLDGNFLLSSQERELKHLGRLMDLRENASESVVYFWMRYEQLILVLEWSSSTLSPSFLFIRALKSLDFTALQRSTMLTFLECQPREHTWGNLKKATLELFSTYSSSTSSGKGSHSVLHSHDESGGGVVLHGEDQVFVIRKKGKGGRNRPNMEKMAVRRTPDAANLKNQILAFVPDSKGSSKGVRCFRCGKPDRTLRNCPFPYTPVLAYSPSRGKDGTFQKICLLTPLEPHTPLKLALDI